MPPYQTWNRTSSQISGRSKRLSLSALIVFVLLGSASPSPAQPSSPNKNHLLTPEVLNPAEIPDAHLRLKRGASPLAEGALSPQLQSFLSQFVLIKTPHGYILGRSQRSDPNAVGGAESNFQLRQRRLPAEHNYQLRVRKSMPSEQNFQLRVRKPYNAAENNYQLRVRKSSPRSAESNFQLRVRKPFPSPEDNFQLRVRKDGYHPAAENNFQLRVRKAFPSAEKNFQLRVRKPFPSPEHNFQLRVRKPYPSAEDNFQLRVRKSVAADNFQLRVRKPFPSAEDNFQLRVRKSNGVEKNAIDELLNRFHLLKTLHGGYILKDTKGKREETSDYPTSADDDNETDDQPLEEHNDTDDDDLDSTYYDELLRRNE